MRARWWIWALAALVIAALAWWWIRRRKAAAAPGDLTVITNAADTTPADFPLRQGSRGLEVLQLQGFLNMNFKAGLALDGIFGPLTQAAWRTHGSQMIGSTANVVSRELWNYYIADELEAVNSYLRNQGITI